MGERIILGHITGAHGIKGDVVVRTYTADPADVGAYGALGDEDGSANLIVETVRVTPKGAIVRFVGILDRTAAEQLRGRALTVPRSALPAAADDEYYHADLIGMTAVDPHGAVIGTVVAIQDFGAGTLLDIRLEGSKITELVPFTDPHVPTVDIAAKRLTVIMPVLIDAPVSSEATTDDA